MKTDKKRSSYRNTSFIQRKLENKFRIFVEDYALHTNFVPWNYQKNVSKRDGSRKELV